MKIHNCSTQAHCFCIFSLYFYLPVKNLKHFPVCCLEFIKELEQDFALNLVSSVYLSLLNSLCVIWNINPLVTDAIIQ